MITFETRIHATPATTRARCECGWVSSYNPKEHVELRVELHLASEDHQRYAQSK